MLVGCSEDDSEPVLAPPLDTGPTAPTEYDPELEPGAGRAAAGAGGGDDAGGHRLRPGAARARGRRAHRRVAGGGAGRVLAAGRHGVATAERRPAEARRAGARGRVRPHPGRRVVGGALRRRRRRGLGGEAARRPPGRGRRAGRRRRRGALRRRRGGRREPAGAQRGRRGRRLQLGGRGRPRGTRAATPPRRQPTSRASAWRQNRRATPPTSPTSARTPSAFGGKLVTVRLGEGRTDAFARSRLTDPAFGRRSPTRWPTPAPAGSGTAWPIPPSRPTSRSAGGCRSPSAPDRSDPLNHGREAPGRSVTCRPSPGRGRCRTAGRRCRPR